MAIKLVGNDGKDYREQPDGTFMADDGTVFKTSGRSAAAFDYRRYITLVQVLARGGSDVGIRQLCEQWDVKIIEDRSEPPYRGQYPMNQWATIIALAQHCIEYHRHDA